MRLFPIGRPPAANDAAASIAFASVTPDYFRTMRIPLRAGRVFTEQDGANAPLVVIVNQALAQRLFAAGENPLGHRLDAADSRIFNIVGVVGDIQYQLPAERPAPEAFFPLSQSPWDSVVIVLRTPEESTALGRVLQREVSAIDASLPIYNLLTMRERLTMASQGERFHTAGVAAFAGLALLLAAIGIYGVVSYAVGQRSREIGIRMALGAERSQIVQLIVWHSLPWALTGILAGVVLALAFTRYIRIFLWQAKPNDPTILIGASLFLISVALVACWIPAVRAARTEPVRALREI